MERILVALDGSTGAEGVLHAAVALAGKTGGKLVLFRAIGLPSHLPDETFGLPPAQVTDLLRRKAETYLKSCAEHVPPANLASTRVDIGNAWRAICAAADEENADLVVLGAHGYDVVDRVLGTTTAKVVNHTTRSVLVVRSPAILD